MSPFTIWSLQVGRSHNAEAETSPMHIQPQDQHLINEFCQSSLTAVYINTYARSSI